MERSIRRRRRSCFSSCSNIRGTSSFHPISTLRAASLGRSVSKQDVGHSPNDTIGRLGGGWKWRGRKRRPCCFYRYTSRLMKCDDGWWFLGGRAAKEEPFFLCPLAVVSFSSSPSSAPSIHALSRILCSVCIQKGCLAV